MNLALILVIWHIVTCQLLTFSYILNFVQIGKTFCTWTDIQTDTDTGFIRSTPENKDQLDKSKHVIINS